MPYPAQRRPHPAEIRDAAQEYIERQYRPVRTFDVQREITNRYDTNFGGVASDLMKLERDGKICKYVSPESGVEYWFSPTSDLFCATCGLLALPGVHPQPDCPRRPSTTSDEEVSGVSVGKVKITRAMIQVCYCRECGAESGEPCKDKKNGQSHQERQRTAQVAFHGADPRPPS